MLSNKKIICPNNLIKVAKKKGIVDAAIVNAGEILPMESVHKAVKNNYSFRSYSAYCSIKSIIFKVKFIPIFTWENL